jgi:ankyrin repeat protein
VGCSAFHVAAAHPTQDSTFRDLLGILLQHFNKPVQIDTRAKTPAKSTALQMAVSALNDVAVELLLKADADFRIRDPSNRSCLEVASKLPNNPLRNSCLLWSQKSAQNTRKHSAEPQALWDYWEKRASGLVHSMDFYPSTTPWLSQSLSLTG